MDKHGQTWIEKRYPSDIYTGTCRILSYIHIYNKTSLSKMGFNRTYSDLSLKSIWKILLLTVDLVFKEVEPDFVLTIN